MAEDLVLASLIINADGTVLAVNQAGQAITGLQQRATPAIAGVENKWKSATASMGISSKRLLDGFLNIRQVIRGLFIGFSVGAAILALGNLIAETITATEWFKRAKEAVIDFFRAIVVGESSAERAMRKMREIGKEFGVRTFATIELEIKDAEKGIKRLQALLSPRQEVASTGPNIFGASRLFMRTVIPTESELLSARNGIEQLRIKVLELKTALETEVPFVEALPMPRLLSQEELNQSRITEEDIVPKGGLFPDLRANEEALSALTSDLDFLRKGFLDATITGLEFAEGLDRGEEKIRTYGGSIFTFANDNIAVLQDAYDSGRISLQDFNLALEHQNELLRSVGDNFTNLVDTTAEWAAVIGAVRSGLQELAASGIRESRTLYKAIEILIIAEAILRGKLELGYGAAAVAAQNYVVAALHFIAAATFFAVAAGKAQGLASGGGGGGGRGGRGGGSDVGGSEATPNRSGSTIIISIDGGIYPGTKEELGRTLSEILRQAQRDNA